MAEQLDGPAFVQEYLDKLVAWDLIKDDYNNPLFEELEDSRFTFDTDYRGVIGFGFNSDDYAEGAVWMFVEVLDRRGGDHVINVCYSFKGTDMTKTKTEVPITDEAERKAIYEFWKYSCED